MKKTLFIYPLILIGLSCCSDDNSIETAHFVISSKNIADNSLISGGQYSIFNSNNEIVGTYTLDHGTIELTELPIGSYTIKEIAAPEGYVSELNEKKYEPYNIKFRDITFYYIDEQNRTLPESIKLKFYASEHYEFYGNYNAVRIGEYYWIDKNFTHTVRQGNGFENDLPITQGALNKYLERIWINPSQYQLTNINEF
ncbi:hypothetical protein JGH11_17195, partial [Dysgonomonas sp. Marseille-P4677]|uniref:prealbumin-like fold domain-containing protein n=1 Tax=Dysgonomonas sp. Marseille-P4677 TaxID=2364790 RepID=UPI001A449C22